MVETAHPDNQVNLIIDVAVYPITRDANTVLHERLEELKDKTPDVEELHDDGTYESSDNDEECAKQGLVQVQTEVWGPKPTVYMSIEHRGQQVYSVSCPRQTVVSTPTGKQHKTVFALSMCTDCSLRDRCPTSKRKSHRVWYFSYEQCLALKRQGVTHTFSKSGSGSGTP